MLKIKDEKWQEFCERAKEFGFYENKNIETHDCHISNDFNAEFVLSLDNDNKELYFYTKTKERIYVDNLDILYDLITQGFVEKV